MRGREKKDTCYMFAYLDLVDETRQDIYLKCFHSTYIKRVMAIRWAR